MAIPTRPSHRAMRWSRLNLPSGEYRSIMGNQAAAIGSHSRCRQKSGVGASSMVPIPSRRHPTFYMNWRDTKTTALKPFKRKTRLRRSVLPIGASYGGSLGRDGLKRTRNRTERGGDGSWPSCWKSHLLIINVQRGGPSTGLPTKTEQSDLMQAMYGRNGEAPLAIVSASQ